MRKLRVGRPSAAMIVAVVALCFALVGTGLAASALTGAQKKQVRKIINKKSGKLQVASANFANNIMAATVPQGTVNNANTCAIGSQTGGITSAIVGGNNGFCDITFPRSVGNCSVGATPMHPLSDIGGQASIRPLGGRVVRVTRRNDVSNFQDAGLFTIFAICPA